MAESDTSSMGIELAKLTASIPEPIASGVDRAVAALTDAVASSDAKPLGVGDRAPDFTLPDAHGRLVRLADRLAEGPMVLTFYRGDWCPFCNIELRALGSAMPMLTQRGASLIAVSPQPPDRALALAERDRLTFDVLSDIDQRAIRAYGLRSDVVGGARALYDDVLHFDVSEQNGDGSWTLPVPATYVIDGSSVIVAACADPDYRRRMEVDAITAALDALEPRPVEGSDHRPPPTSMSAPVT